MALKFIDTKKISSDVSPKKDESILIKNFSDQFHAIITRKSIRTGSICSLAIPDKAKPSELLENLKSVQFRNNLRDYSADIFQATRLPVFGSSLTNNVGAGESYVQVSTTPSFIESGDTVFFVRPVNGLYNGDPGDAEGPFYIDEVKANSFKIFPKAPKLFDSSFVVLFLSKDVAAVDFLQSGILQNHEMISIYQSNTIELSDTLLIETEARAYKVTNKEEHSAGRSDLRLFPLPKVTHPEGRVVYTRTPINNAPSYTLPSGSTRFNFNFIYDTNPEDDFAYVPKGTLRVDDVFYIENNTLIPYTVLSIDDKFPNIDKVFLNKQIGKHYRGIKQGPFNVSLVRLYNPNNELLDIKDISKNTSIVSISFDESNQTPYFLTSSLDSSHNHVYNFVAGDFPSFQPDYLTKSLNLKYLNNVETPIDFAVYQNVAYVLTDAKRVIAYTLKGVAMEVLNFEHIDDDITSIDYFSDFVSLKTTFGNPIKKHVDNITQNLTLPEYTLVKDFYYNGSRFDQDDYETSLSFKDWIDASAIMASGNNRNCLINYGPLTGVNLSETTLRYLMAFDGYFKYWRIKRSQVNPDLPVIPLELEWVGPVDRGIVYEDELALDKTNEFSPIFKYIRTKQFADNFLLKVRSDWDNFYNNYSNDKIKPIVHTGIEKTFQLDAISRRFLRYLVLTGASGHVYLFDLIINRTVLATKIALHNPSLICSSSLKKIKNKLNSIEFKDEYRAFMSEQDVLSTVSTCSNLDIANYDYEYSEKLFFSDYKEYFSDVLNSVLKPVYSGAGGPYSLNLKISPSNLLTYERDLVINSATTVGIDLTKSILNGLAIYRNQENSIAKVKFTNSKINEDVHHLSLVVSLDGISEVYQQPFLFEAADSTNILLDQTLQQLTKKINHSVTGSSLVSSIYEAASSEIVLKSKISGERGNLVSFEFLVYDTSNNVVLPNDYKIKINPVSANLSGGFDITPDEFKIDSGFPSTINAYIERNNLYPVISGSADSKAGITLISSNLNLKAKVFEYAVKAWGDHGEPMIATEITPILTVYENKDYNSPKMKVNGSKITTDEKGVAFGTIPLESSVINSDSSNVDFLIQFQTKVVYQPNNKSLYLYDLSQTNIKGDERISFRVLGAMHPSNLAFKLIQDKDGFTGGASGTPIITEVNPIYLGNQTFELDFRDSAVSEMLEKIENGSVLVLEAIEEINIAGQRYNQSNGVAIIYTGLDNN